MANGSDSGRGAAAGASSDSSDSDADERPVRGRRSVAVVTDVNPGEPPARPPALTAGASSADASAGTIESSVIRHRHWETVGPQQHWGVPDPRYTTFIGRDTLLAKIAERFVSGPIVTLIGLPGSGRSTLSREYVKRHKGDHQHVIYIDCNEGLAQTLSHDLAPVLQPELVGELNIERCSREIAEWLSAQPPGSCLFVFENASADDAALIRRFSGCGQHLLVEAREWPHPGDNLEVEAFTEDNAIAFLKSLLGDRKVGYLELGSPNLRDLVQKITCLPQVLMEVASFFQHNVDANVENFFQVYDADASDVLRAGSWTAYRTIFTGLAPEQQRLLQIIAACGEGDVPTVWLRSVLKEAPFSLDGSAARSEVNTGLRALQEGFLLDVMPVTHTVRIHSIIRRLVSSAEFTAADTKIEIQQALCLVLQRRVTKAIDEREPVAQLLQLRLHVVALSTAYSDDRHDLTQIILLDMLASLDTRLGNQEAAVTNVRAAIELQKEIEDDPQLRATLHCHLGEALSAKGDAYPEAKEAFNAALGALPDRPEYRQKRAHYALCVGNAAIHQGETEDAKRHFDMAQTLFTQASDIEGCAQALMDRANTFWESEAQHPMAHECLTRAVNMLSRHYGDTMHPLIGQAISMLAPLEAEHPDWPATISETQVVAVINFFEGHYGVENEHTDWVRLNYAQYLIERAKSNALKDSKDSAAMPQEGDITPLTEQLNQSLTILDALHVRYPEAPPTRMSGFVMHAMAEAYEAQNDECCIEIYQRAHHILHRVSSKHDLFARKAEAGFQRTKRRFSMPIAEGAEGKDDVADAEADTAPRRGSTSSAPGLHFHGPVSFAGGLTTGEGAHVATGTGAAAGEHATTHVHAAGAAKGEPAAAPAADIATMQADLSALLTQTTDLAEEVSGLKDQIATLQDINTATGVSAEFIQDVVYQGHDQARFQQQRKAIADNPNLLSYYEYIQQTLITKNIGALAIAGGAAPGQSNCGYWLTCCGCLSSCIEGLITSCFAVPPAIPIAAVMTVALGIAKHADNEQGRKEAFDQAFNNPVVNQAQFALVAESIARQLTLALAPKIIATSTTPYSCGYKAVCCLTQCRPGRYQPPQNALQSMAIDHASSAMSACTEGHDTFPELLDAMAGKVLVEHCCAHCCRCCSSSKEAVIPKPDAAQATFATLIERAAEGDAKAAAPAAEAEAMA